MTSRHRALQAHAVTPRTALPAREGFDAFWRWMVDDELPAIAAFLPEAERREFVNYYREMPAPHDTAALERLTRGAWRGEAGWAYRWIDARLARGVPVSVLDAGAGFGTHALLFASLGATVRGVDLRPDRLSVAERRALFRRYRTGLPLSVDFTRADLTRTWSEDHDLIWVHNALSHIEPLDDFLRCARTHLRPGGVLVIGDINGSLQGHRTRLARLRQQIATTYVAPDGSHHGYAIERLFPPAELRALMRHHGFRVARHELYWGGQGVLPASLYESLVAPLQEQWWLGAWVARRQLLVATAD